MTDESTPQLSPAPADVPANGKTPAAVEDGDGIEFYGAGWVRVTIDGTAYRLRRPFFGEVRDLRVLMEGLNDDVTLASERAVATARTLQRRDARARKLVDDAQAKIASGADDAPDEDTMADLEDQLAAEVAAIRVEDRRAGRAVTTLAEDNRVKWWRAVFDTLSLDGTPKGWPAWLLDPAGVDPLLNHWRHNPLAPG